jgi:hypothetical protein
VIFNTRLYSTNFHELPMLVRFFRDNADVAGMAAFNCTRIASTPNASTTARLW